VISVRYYALVNRLIVADSHVGTVSGDAQKMSALVRQLPTQGIDELIYLGDAFQYLIGMSKFWTRSVREVMAAWNEVRARGIRIVLVEGNRDFFLDEPELAAMVDWAGRYYEFEVDGHRYRLDHGDRVNLRDVQYQFWSRVSKSRFARAWARLLPQSVAVKIVRTMEARLAATNVRFRYRTPVAALRRSARRAWAEGIHVLLWGHFHGWWECSDNARRAMVVPAWLETTSSLAVMESGDHIWMDERFSRIAPPAESTAHRGNQ
jgi:UDP-2,3-diacylglucosamine hydrolase